ncbi:hypothetical protein [Aurantiacibacter sediminis]|uniref:Uncharacterized protein n=1 Tax=Aurantiacibacter sediminis TaxID=2793064 RepID=A0ABS0N2D3_9SPHN|nr:hypothetical protein [Aurantiacibacter sediminis]MBH5322125.1 hypothetical protein [Aurantiacibacter sediminis]
MKFIVTLAASAAIAALPATAAAQGLPSMPRLNAPSLDLSEREISQFIELALQIETILEDGTLDDVAMRAAIDTLIAESDFEAERFMAIAEMIADNRLLRRRLPSEVLSYLTED